MFEAIGKRTDDESSPPLSMLDTPPSTNGSLLEYPGMPEERRESILQCASRFLRVGKEEESNAAQTPVSMSQRSAACDSALQSQVDADKDEELMLLLREMGNDTQPGVSQEHVEYGNSQHSQSTLALDFVHDCDSGDDDFGDDDDDDETLILSQGAYGKSQCSQGELDSGWHQQMLSQCSDRLLTAPVVVSQQRDSQRNENEGIEVGSEDGEDDDDDFTQVWNDIKMCSQQLLDSGQNNDDDGENVQQEDDVEDAANPIFIPSSASPKASEGGVKIPSKPRRRSLSLGRRQYKALPMYKASQKSSLEKRRKSLYKTVPVSKRPKRSSADSFIDAAPADVVPETPEHISLVSAHSSASKTITPSPILPPSSFSSASPTQQIPDHLSQCTDDAVPASALAQISSEDICMSLSRAVRNSGSAVTEWEFKVKAPHPVDVLQRIQSRRGSTINRVSLKAKASQISGVTTPTPPSSLPGPHTNDKPKSRPSEFGMSTDLTSCANRHITFISVEVFATSTGRLTPNPSQDPVCAVCMHVRCDDADHAYCGDSGDPRGRCDFTLILTQRGGPNNVDAVARAMLNPNTTLDPLKTRTNSLLYRRTIPGTFASSELNPIIIESDDEASLLLQFVLCVRRVDPDIVVGYEVQRCSLGYLFDRARLLKLPLSRALSRAVWGQQDARHMNDEWGHNEQSGFWIPGRYILNLWRVLRKELTLRNYEAESVALHVLNRRVPKYSPELMNAWWNDGNGRSRWMTLRHILMRCTLNVEIIDCLDIVGKYSELAMLFGVDFLAQYPAEASSG